MITTLAELIDELTRLLQAHPEAAGMEVRGYNGVEFRPPSPAMETVYGPVAAQEGYVELLEYEGSM